MKKVLLFIFILLSFFLIGCNEENKIKITIINGEGTGEYTLNQIVSATVSLNEGETFIGWTIDGALVSTENTYIFKAKEDVTITAEISGRAEPVVDYTITYNLDGGVGTNPSTYNKKTKTFTLSNPTKEGYIFTGWTYDGHTTPVKSVQVTKGTTGDLEFTANWEQYTKPTSFTPLKVGIFADIQLTDGNQGETANAYISLVNHFKCCKDQNVDVIFMNGDICNNAIEDYYRLFEKALKSVYGTDESKYPEFVMNMGNHEWWDSNEKNTANAVNLFKKYARIESDNLVKTSNVKYALSTTDTLPSYYKVINGVPFLVISGNDSSGNVSNELRAEVEDWLSEIQQLEYVKAGGPIFVAYHCALQNYTYDGLCAGTKSNTVNQIFSGIPNAIIFTGDTHFPSINDRTINQELFTCINIGSSSYSRMMNHSATSICTSYANMKKTTSGKAMDQLGGEAAYLHEYTENMMIATFESDGTTSIKRYITNEYPTDFTQVGIEWEIPLTLSKDDFIYTDDRFENKEWANKLYGKDGLTFDTSSNVTFNVVGTDMMVYFPDVIDYHYCEHYIITIEKDNDPSKTLKYDFVSSYYKWEDEGKMNHFICENVGSATSYKVIVTAYDYFDNPSLNVLTSEVIDENTYIGDPIDLAVKDSYTDISTKVNYDIHSSNSTSSLEYYYKGLMPYKYGATLFTLCSYSGVNANEYLSITNWNHPVLTIDVKNLCDVDIKIGLTVVVYNNEGITKWLTDCGKEYQKTVLGNSDWVTLQWDLYQEFGIDSLDEINRISFKTLADSSFVDTENGYSFNFLVDNADIIDYSGTPIVQEYPVQAESMLYLNKQHTDISKTSIDSISFLMKMTSVGDMSVSIFDSSWKESFTYCKVVKDGVFNTNQTIFSCEDVGDGWMKVTVDSSQLGDNVSFIQFRKDWTTGTAIIKELGVNYK